MSEFIWTTVHETMYSFYKEHAADVANCERIVATSHGISKLLAKFDRHIAKEELEDHLWLARFDYALHASYNNSAVDNALLEDKNRELVSNS